VSAKPLSADAQEFYDLLIQLDAHQMRVIGLLTSLMALPHDPIPQGEIESEQYSLRLLGIVLEVYRQKPMPEEIAFTETLIRQSEARLAELKGELS
jgi:hypothetical protein